MNYRTKFILNQIINACTPTHKHLELVIFTDLRFRIKMCSELSCVGLKMVKMKNRKRKSGHDCYTNIHCTFPQVFFSKISDPPKRLNTTLDHVKISKKLTSVSPILSLFIPKLTNKFGLYIN